MRRAMSETNRKFSDPLLCVVVVKLGRGICFIQCIAATAKLLQSCLTVRPHRRQTPGSSIHGIFQARVLEWGATAFSTQSTNSKLIRSGTILTDTHP